MNKNSKEDKQTVFQSEISFQNAKLKEDSNTKQNNFFHQTQFIQYLFKQMPKKNQMIIENCFLSLYKVKDLHPCKLYFYQNNVIQIQKTLKNYQQLSSKQLIGQNMLSFGLNININLEFIVALQQKTLRCQNSQKIEILLLNKQTYQQIRLYTPKKTETFLKIYNYFKKRVWMKGFKQFYEIIQMLKSSSHRQKVQYFIVKQKSTQNIKMLKRYAKQGSKIQSLSKVLNQIRLQNKVSSENIVKFDSFFEDNDFLYLVYSQAPTKNLKQFIKQFKQGSKLHIRTIIKQLLEGVLQMEINGVVHSNINPSTIQLIKENQNWRCCLNHFNRAILTTQMNQNIELTHHNYGYTAPQLLHSNGIKLSSKSDVFSIGAVFYYILFDKALFSSSQTTKKCVDPYPQIDFKTQIMKALPFECLELLQKLLYFDPDKRISIIQALKHRYFTTRNQQIIKSPAKSLKKQRNIKSRKQHNSIPATGIIKPSCEKQNLDPKNQLTPSPQKLELKKKFSHFRKSKISSIERNSNEGQIDSDEIDDTHINLEPKKLNIMTPSYELKNRIQFKVFTL